MYWKFAIWLALASVGFEIAYAFLMLPLLFAFYMARSRKSMDLEDPGGQEETAESAGGLLALGYLCSGYVLLGWVCCCSLITKAIVARPQVEFGFIYWITAFTISLWPLATDPRERYGETNIWPLLGMITFLVTAFWPTPALFLYGWAIRLVL